MMRRLSAGWLSFRRIHLAALAADWRRTLLSVIGVAVGVMVVLGVLVLKSELVRPFDAFGPSLAQAADRGVVEVAPNVNGRLPIDTVDRLRTEVAGAQAVIPIVANLTPVDLTGGNSTPPTEAASGFFLLGGSCQIELLVGPFNCEQRAHEEPAAGPGVPLQIPAVIAQRHHLQLGAELRIPGLPPGSAHVGWTFPEFDRVAGINGGYVLMAPSGEIAAELLSARGYVTAAFVVPRPEADVAADIDRVIAGVATAGPPRPHLPAMFASATQSLDLTALCGVLIGFLIAMNTILLAVEDRRAVLGTVGAIGAKPVGLFGGMLGEGAVVGLLGGLAGVPGGFLLGSYLVDRFARSMLSGSGGTVAAHFSPSLIVVGAVAGAICGLLAMIGPATRLVREGPLASMASAGGVQRVRTIPIWPLLVGTAALSGAVAVMVIYEHGSLPTNAGINAMSVWQFGVAMMTVWLPPARCRTADRAADCRPPRRRPSTGSRRPTLCAVVRRFRGDPGHRHQFGDRSAEPAVARHRAGRCAEGSALARLPAGLRPIDPRSARLPPPRCHLRAGGRRGPRAQRVVAMEGDDLVGHLVTPRCRRHAR